MSKEEYLSKIEFGIAYIAFGFVLLFQYSRAFSEEELMLFVELMMAYVWTAGLFIYAKFRFDIHIFEPITMITAIYEGIFVVKPIIDLRNHEMIEHGISVIGGGHKATLLFALGFTAFFFAYYLNHRHIVYRGHPIFRKTRFSWRLAAMALWRMGRDIHTLLELYADAGIEPKIYLFVWHGWNSLRR